MSRGVRSLQWMGLLTLALSSFWPVFQQRSFPVQGLSVPPAGVIYTVGEASVGVGLHPVGAQEVPLRELGAAILESARGPGRLAPFWERRRWYPYFLLPLWILALLWSRRSPGARRFAGALLWLLALGLALFEALYLRVEYAPFLSGVSGRVEGLVVWLLVLTILFYRRPADRTLAALEATVASQALLGFVHALTLPSTMARGWWGAFDDAAVLESVGQNFPPAFWIGCGGLLLAALPVYLRRRDASAPTGQG